jgi:hypothetical protein
VLTPRALATHGLPVGQGFTVGGLPTRWGDVEVAEAGRLDGAQRWRRRVVASGGSDELLRHLGGTRSLGTRQLKKKSTRGRAHRRGRGGGALARF